MVRPAQIAVTLPDLDIAEALLGWHRGWVSRRLVVHSLGDVLGFTILWRHDQIVHGMGFADPLFAPARAAIAIFTPLANLALRELAVVGRNLRPRAG